jgi:hypothetical protein
MPGSHTKGLFLELAAIVAIGGTAAPVSAKKAAKATPLPAPTGVAPGYYLMSGNQIVSPQYQNLAECYKDLALIKHRMVPGSDTLACVHRTQ